jgi:hypothetical protein
MIKFISSCQNLINNTQNQNLGLFNYLFILLFLVVFYFYLFPCLENHQLNYIEIRKFTHIHLSMQNLIVNFFFIGIGIDCIPFIPFFIPIF